MYIHWKAQVEIVQEVPLPLPQCPIYGMNMHAEMLIKHHRTYRCNQETGVMLWRRDVEIAQISGEMNVSLYNRKDYPLIEGGGQVPG